MSERTLQALRQLVVATLQTPSLQYFDQTGAVVTLDPTSVYAKSIWQVGDAPSPMIAFSVIASGSIGRMSNERYFGIDFWIVSSSGPDEATEIYEALRPRFHLADQEAPRGSTDLSRCAEGAALGISVRMSVERRVLPAEFESSSQRWYISAAYDVAAT